MENYSGPPTDRGPCKSTPFYNKQTFIHTHIHTDTNMYVQLRVEKLTKNVVQNLKYIPDLYFNYYRPKKYFIMCNENVSRLAICLKFN